MSSQSFETYRHSGKFGVQGPVLALVLALVAGFFLGFAYAYLVKWIPLVFLRFLATLGYGFIFGFLGVLVMKYGKVRNSTVAFLCGAGVGLLALYFAWSAHIHALFKGAPLLVLPWDMLSVMKELYEHGSWSLRRSGPVTGIGLAIVWLVEAGIIVGFAALMPFGTIADTPFCEKNECWLDEEKKIDTLAPFSDPAQIESLKAGDLGPLVKAQPRVPGAYEFARLTLKHSPKCDVFCTVRVENVSVETDKDGNASEKTQELTRPLMLPHTMFDLIAKFEKFSAPPPAGG